MRTAIRFYIQYSTSNYLKTLVDITKFMFDVLNYLYRGWQAHVKRLCLYLFTCTRHKIFSDYKPYYSTIQECYIREVGHVFVSIFLM